MATKTTKKATAKTSQKSTKAKKSSGISLGSNRGRFILAIFIVAVLGGGIMVYRSFASVSASWTYTIDSGTMVSASGANNSPCKAANIKDTAKNNTTVANLTCSADGAASIAKTQGAAASANRPYRMCAVIKGTGTVAATFTVPGRVGNNQTSMTFYPKADYSQHCTAAIDAQNAGPITAVVSATKRGTNVRVSSITIDLLSSSYASTSSVSATPAPSKNPGK